VTSRSTSTGIAAWPHKATDIRRILAEVENNARSLRDRQGILESQLLTVPAASPQKRATFLIGRAGGLRPARQRELS
jgi:hypothetical protein